jgi:hypothetical protein
MYGYGGGVMKVFIGIDNGVTGSIGVIETDGVITKSAFIATPIRRVRDYTKEEQFFQRIDWPELVKGLSHLVDFNHPDDIIAVIERPMVNPRAFVATKSALRAFEATIIALEYLNISFSYIDSKEWQKEFLSSAFSGRDELKKASLEVGLQLFPSNGTFIRKHGDADGLLLAEYTRRKSFK